MAVPMIAERIYRGENAEEIGIPEAQYASRKETLDRFLEQWKGSDFRADYAAWLRMDQSGDRGPGGRRTHTAERTPRQPSRGLGDTVARITLATGLDKLAAAYERKTGKPCGCKGRQQKLNRLIPYRR